MESYTNADAADRPPDDASANEATPSPDALVNDGMEGAERRRHAGLAHLVNIGVQIFLADGRQMAELFLRSRQVPSHVVLRVLACAAFRRKPCIGVSLTQHAEVVTGRQAGQSGNHP